MLQLFRRSSCQKENQNLYDGIHSKNVCVHFYFIITVEFPQFGKVALMYLAAFFFGLLDNIVNS